MIRKSVFWGLAIVLAVVLVNLVLRGRRLEKQQAGKPVEVIQESASTPTRVLKPKDLEVVRLKMRLEKKAHESPPCLRALHEIEIRNKDKTSYGKIQLKIDYLDRKGKVLAAKPYSAAGPIMPGDILRLADIGIEGLPVHVTDCRISIDYAEMASIRPLK
jgi:hypothetical protein